MSVSQKYLKKYLYYDKETGVFTRLISNSNRIKNGEIAGYICKEGYVKIYIYDKQYMAHRLAWLYTHGKLPEKQIDHINHDRADNRLFNLREVNNLDNHKNTKKRIDNTSGHNGVIWNKATKSWRSRINVRGQVIHLGLFNNIEDAVAARKIANKQYNYHQNHGLLS